MQTTSINFEFLSKSGDDRLRRLATLAERYFRDDAPSALAKLRTFAELLAKEVAAAHGVLPAGSPSFDDVLFSLRRRSELPRQVADMFYHLKQAGNRAVHEEAGTASEALTALKFARSLAVWFYQTYRHQPNFKPGPFVPPAPPVDMTEHLEREMQALRDEVAASRDAEAQARLAASDAEAARASAVDLASQRDEERQFWEQYAAETEAKAREAETQIAQLQEQAAAAPQQQLDLLAFAAATAADNIELDEASTRVLIDEALRASGWEVDSVVLRHASGARPVVGRNMAIAEWPTETGPVDYALFVDGRCIGVVEAKRGSTDVPGRLSQAKRYARGIILSEDEQPLGGPWAQGVDLFRVPFMFATNGRPYVKQLATKSGIWFWNARTGEAPKALAEWFSPRDLEERLQQEVGEPASVQADRELGVSGLRPYQIDAIGAVTDAIGAGQQSILLSMATGTGKTRLAIALMYELLRAKRFRRILFLVDRNALGRQTLDAMATTDTQGFLKFSDVFNVADLATKFPEASTRVQVATVQAMVRRLFDEPGPERPTPGTYDLIIVDEAHRGYTLDAELREDDLAFRTLDDYLSAYRRVLDYFDATTIALTATPALHTREIFGPPVYSYGYRQAVIDGYLIDHRPPRRITTALSQTGISFEQGEEVTIIDPKTGEVNLFDLEDQVDFEVAQFNRKVYTEPFNKAVAQAIAVECPPQQPGKTLLFAARDDHADILIEALREALEEEYGPQPHDIVAKITGSVDKPLDAIKAFKNDPRPKYVVTVDLLTTGIDVPAITNLVFVRRVNSRILYDQMIGRATRRCDEIGKAYFRIFDAVDIYANLQDFTDMHPVVVKPQLSFTDLVRDLERAPTETDRAVVRDQIVVKLQNAIRRLGDEQRTKIENHLGSLDALVEKLRASDPEETLSLFRQYPSLPKALYSANGRDGRGIFVAPHEDELISVEDDFGDKASPADYISGFEAYVKANMNLVPALIAATQKPRDLTRAELREIALLLDAQGYSEAALRRAYGSARNADIAAHIIGFVRQAALGDPLVPYETRVENGVQKILASRDWTPAQKRWLSRIGRALREQPVGDPVMLADGAFAQNGGFTEIDKEFDHKLSEVLMDLNSAIWDSGQAA
ncbi:type I restriction-modification system endonuclease [Novosphingobium album (ex Hu et al. 2023)]|uniref:Type I restriction-modification system endonuclease n=1 Tax=Novosphingobium album (ex Hu et al. 2023) TaxID=2930093 RepID=A0ABT0B6X2_9SPHN|nr:type I restriction-modification system endonuclease [Novosphingobium album (ex Hu et al. 2023)]MCJ2180815.1 type I restriction-modification system endonuclease [Novosphingobium album (ex Hu et al. 2023)]